MLQKMLQKTRNSNDKGFTLIELMVVIAIIGILTAIAVPNYLAYRTRGQDNAASSDARNFYSLALAGFADDDPGPYGPAALPPGYSGAAPSGGAMSMDAAGAVTCTITFLSASGTTFTLDDGGNIT